MPAILIVDDEALDGEMAARCLEPIEDLAVQHARDGREALQSIAWKEPDLVLTDLRMPRMDGLALVRAIGEEHAGVPVILMTSKGSEQDAVRALQAGAASYVLKDDLRQDLVRTVLQVLDVAAEGRSKRRITRYLEGRKTRFRIGNDPALIPPLVAFLQDGLDRIGFERPAVRTQIGIALAEALSNAMVHGNLEVASDLRDRDTDAFHRLIEKRRALEPYAGRRVHCTARESPGRIDYVVRDEGPGFRPLAESGIAAIGDPMRVRDRALVLIRAFMDTVEHNARGNEITMSKRAGQAAF